jgi:hypothetical protein
MVALYMVLWFPAKFSQMPETLLGEFQLLEAHPARALEVIVTGDCRVAALVADEPAVWSCGQQNRHALGDHDGVFVVGGRHAVGSAHRPTVRI